MAKRHRFALPSTLKFRMTTVVILLVLLATVVVAWVALAVAARDTRAIIGDQQYALLSEAAAYIDSQLVTKQTILATTVENVPPEALRDPAAFRAHLAAFKAVRKQFPNMVAFDRDGRMVANLRDGDEAHGIRANGRAYFEDTLRTKAGLISAPFRSVISGAAVVVVTQPVFDSDGQVAYVVAGGIDLAASKVFNQVELIRAGRTGFMFIMTDKGILVSHPDKGRLLQHVNARPGTNLATERALAGFEGWMEARGKDDMAGLYSYKRLRTTNWIVGARFPADEAFAPLVQLGRNALAVAALVAALAGAFAWFAIRRLLRPLEVLRHNIAEVKDGRADIGVLQLPHGDEIGVLSEEFHVLMAERERAEHRTRASELLIRSILEQAPDAFVSTDSEGVITEWNVRAERTFGWSRQEALGRNIAELLVPERLRSEHVAGMRQFALSGSGPIIGNRLRVPAKHRDGREIPVELSVSAVRTGEHYSATAFLHDISALIAHEEQIAASEKRARTIADAMPALIAYIDREQRFAFTNRRYGQVLGVDPATMLGKTIAEVEGEAAYAQLREQVEAALAGRKVHFEREGEGGDQPAHYMIDFIPDVTADGAVAGFYAMVLDISERKSAELKQAESERRADAASRAKSEFVANMSHEIRTPMNAVLGIAQLLERTDLSAEQRKYLDMIRASGSALLGILNDILDFSKVEAGRIELAPTPFALSTVLDALATIMTLNAGDKDLELAIGVEPDVPPGLHGDAMRLQQVLVNLVGNAVKFTERGEVSLLVELLRREGDEVLLRFVVRDTGIGIAPEQQLQIFSPFSQADASTSRRFGGTGLGLAITRRLVELMGGQLGLESTPGEGSEFSVTLPLGVSNEAGGARPQPARLGALRILVVDDNRTSADYLGKILASWKWQSDTVHSGERALAAAHALAAQGARYDVVLVDWQMEGMGGTDTVAALRALASVQAPPCVIMVSAFGRERVAAADGAQRPDAILLKPVTASSLFDTVQEALAGSGGAARRSPVAASFLAASPIRGRRLLLVEDNELNQVVARGMLEPAGASVFVAENGALAVDVLRAGRQPFDLVLMDVQMPVMDGFEAARIIRKELGLTLPILAMTAGVTMAEQEQCRASGMDGFVPKPVDMDQMIATIAQHLAPRAPAADAAPAAAPTPAHRPAAAAAPAERDGVFDPSALLRIGAGEPTQRRLLDALVSNMATRIPLLLAKADAARAGGRHEELASLMHGLRGSVGSVGAQRFVVAAQALEDALRQRRSGEVDALLAGAERELLATQRAARVWLAHFHAVFGAVEYDAGAPDAAALYRFRRQIASCDPEACELYVQLRPSLHARLAAPARAALDEAMDALDYAEVLVLIAGS